MFIEPESEEIPSGIKIDEFEVVVYNRDGEVVISIGLRNYLMYDFSIKEFLNIIEYVLTNTYLNSEDITQFIGHIQNKKVK